MYSCCLVCHRELGQNTLLANFGVGERIAFSPEDGRLWAICSECGEWNLAPIEERWEAVEECQALYQSTIERASLSGMSLSRMDGLELVRIGSEEELPTLRYGERLRKRQRRHTLRRRLAGVAQAIVLVGVAAASAFLGGFMVFVFALLLMFAASSVAVELANPVVARTPTGEGDWEDVRRHELKDARLVPSGTHGWSLRVRKGRELEGRDAIEAARFMLPLLNRAARPEVQLQKAVKYIEKKGGTTDSVFSAAARRRGQHRTARISKLEAHIRLALEMLASRDTEDRAISQSLHHLQVAWENADELAAIQDELVYGPRILSRFRELKD